MLDWIAEGFCYAALGAVGIEKLGAVCDGPKCKKRLNARYGLRTGCIVGYEREIAETQRLAEAFVVGEEKGLVLDDRTAGGGAENVAFEMRNIAVIEEVASVERAVAQEFVRRSVKLIRAVRGDHIDLGAWSLAVLRAVGVFDDGEFAHGVDTEKLSAEAARCVIHFRGAGELNSVE